MKNINTGLHYPIDLDHIPPNWIADYVGTFATDVQSGFACGAHNTDGKDIAHLRPMNVSREGKIDLSEIKYILLSTILVAYRLAMFSLIIRIAPS